jgi:trans-aconitate methyltransferase
METLLFIVALIIAGLIGTSIIAIIVIVRMFADHIHLGVQFVKTPSWVLNWLAHNIELAETGIVYDLGCGDGAVLTYIKQSHPHATMTGVEGSLMPYLFAKWKTRHINLTLRYEDFYTTKIDTADVIFCFLTKNLMPRLEKHLLATLKKGAIVYSYAFEFPNWKPTREIPHPQNPNRSSMYIYTKK